MTHPQRLRRHARKMRRYGLQPTVIINPRDPLPDLAIVTLGRLLWRYEPTGADALDQPSLALPLPNGDVLANDDKNDRVIVIDPHTNKIVWQYGHTHQPSSQSGYLANPDGVDLAPPYSLTMRFAHSLRAP